MTTARPGRRPGRPDTRAQILDAARACFAEQGYDRTTVRGVAEAAGVDSRLVSHYFGSKQRLFLAAAEPPIDPATMAPRLLAADDPAAALAGFIAAQLESEPYRRFVTGLLRAAASEPEAAEAAREFLTTRFLDPIADLLGADQPRLRAALIGSQIAGIVLARHILALDALVPLGADGLASALAPVIRRYLHEPL